MKTQTVKLGNLKEDVTVKEHPWSMNKMALIWFHSNDKLKSFHLKKIENSIIMVKTLYGNVVSENEILGLGNGTLDFETEFVADRTHQSNKICVEH